LVDEQNLKGMYRRMLQIRQFEERLYYLFVQGIIPGTIHLYLGQEAVAVGVCSNLRQNDVITSTHRAHGHTIAKGVNLNSLMAELFGKNTGCCKGKGGSMHVGDMQVGALPSIAIVGGGIPIAAGVGLSFKFQQTDQVVACFFGDGASNEGAFHEGINMAAIWDLPVVFVCENNLYGASTHVSRVMKIEDIARRADAYGIPGTVVDGNDVIAVYEAVKEAVKNARAGKGPTLVECKTYRRCGHSRGDGNLYRDKEEENEWFDKDPLSRMKSKLIDMGLLTDESAEKMKEEIEAEIDEAIKYAQESPFPKPEDTLQDVFYEEGGDEIWQQ